MVGQEATEEGGRVLRYGKSKAADCILGESISSSQGRHQYRGGNQGSSHGYMRSNQIVNSLSGNSSMSLTKVTTSGSGVRGIIGTNAPGAEFVIGSERQQRFHAASGWRTDEQAIEEKADDIQKLFDAVVKRELNR